jgi:hypothetical protein
VDRLVLGGAWFLAAIVGGFAAIVVQGAGVTSLPVAVLIGNLPSAAVLAAVAGRRDWSVVVGAGWLALGLFDFYAVTPLLSHLLAPLVPRPDLRFTRSAYLPVWIAFYTSAGLIKGALAAGLMWWFVARRGWWIAIWTAGGFVTALTIFWDLRLPVPGSATAGLYVLGLAVDAAALALLWRFDADPPPVALPAYLRPALDGGGSSS